MTEEWRDCPGFEGRYLVSSLGRVWSLISSPPRELTRQFDSDGYAVVGLWNGKRQTNNKVHRLVALAFHADKYNILHCEAAHLDGDRSNPRADNIKWVSKVENRSHRKLHGTESNGERHGNSKLTETAVRDIRTSCESRLQLADKYGVTQWAIDDVRRRRNWKHVR